MKTLKKVLALVLAVACMASLAVTASAAEIDTAYTANVYVAGSDNNVLKGVTAYLTPSGWSANILPTKPSEGNATKTVADNGTVTIVIDLNNTVFRFIEFPGADPELYTSDEGWTAAATNFDDEGYVTQLTYTFPIVNNKSTYTAGVAYRIPNCLLYAKPADIVGSNSGEKYMAVSMMGGETP